MRGRATERESFLTRWTRVIKTMWPELCPRCGLTFYEADGMDCCNFARRGDGEQPVSEVARA